ncbi:hypothetical protein [Klebsiella variicola]|uniref:hypothetical protein n=1 Tax=Klebsiella variicola TaxID=244366 RepID=UPI00144396EE|nr:hypothetical protein [Klebsiella variicola]
MLIFVINISFKEGDLHRFLFLISLYFIALKYRDIQARRLFLSRKYGDLRKERKRDYYHIFFVAEGNIGNIADAGSETKKAP